MTHQTIEFKFLTPGFCAGADQSEAEIRPSSIRGAIRWWFRALGGSREQEELVFGGVRNVVSSAVQLRVSDVHKIDVGQLPAPKPMTPLAYILYFASIAGGESATFGKGPRWNSRACLGPGTTFQLHIRQTRRLHESPEDLLKKSIDAFRHYGSIGMRVTRGFGAIQAKGVNKASFAQLDAELQNRGFVIRRGVREHERWDKLMEEAGRWLKNDLRKEFGAGGGGKPPKPAKASALGSINPVRQTSAIYLRPVEFGGRLIFSAFEAPHTKVLGRDSRTVHSSPVLESRDFTRRPPL